MEFPTLEKSYCDNPPLTVEPSPVGYLLYETAGPKPENKGENKNSNWFLIIIGWAILLLFLILFSWFFLLLFLITIVVFLVNKNYRRRLLWETVFFEPGVLTFSHYPLTLNDSDRLTFRCRLRDNFLTRFFKVKEIPTPSRIEVKLVCVERVSYTKGTDKITENAIIESQTLHRQNMDTGSTEIVSCFDLTIPDHLPVSFEAENNQIRWILLVEKYLPELSEPVCCKFTLQINYPL